MVFFICDACGEALKKKQVQAHTFKCRGCKFSCMDCQTVFDKKSYEGHIKCISENEKYGGANYVPKVNKGELKQDAWVQQVRAAIKFVNDSKLKNLLRQVQNHSNIPRKENKFVNFLQNSLRVRDRELCQQAWQAIKDEAEKLKRNEQKEGGTMAPNDDDGEEGEGKGRLQAEIDQ